VTRPDAPLSPDQPAAARWPRPARQPATEPSEPWALGDQLDLFDDDDDQADDDSDLDTGD
jgi:hypothetical protein